MSHRQEWPQRKRKEQQHKFDDSDANKKSDLCVKRPKNISDEDKFDESDATNKKSDVYLKETNKHIDISGTHVVVEYDSTDLPPVKFVDINSLTESPNKKLSSTDVTPKQVWLFKI